MLSEINQKIQRFEGRSSQMQLGTRKRYCAEVMMFDIGLDVLGDRQEELSRQEQWWYKD
jgi:hypothetical protein